MNLAAGLRQLTRARAQAEARALVPGLPGNVNATAIAEARGEVAERMLADAVRSADGSAWRAEDVREIAPAIYARIAGIRERVEQMRADLEVARAKREAALARKCYGDVQEMDATISSLESAIAEARGEAERAAAALDVAQLRYLERERQAAQHRADVAGRAEKRARAKAEAAQAASIAAAVVLGQAERASATAWGDAQRATAVWNDYRDHHVFADEIFAREKSDAVSRPG